MLQAGEADGIVACKLDRLTRSTKDLLELVEDFCTKRSLELVSIVDNVDNATAAGRLVLTVLGALATWEREAIGERTRKALARLTAQGVRVGAEGYGWGYTPKRPTKGATGSRPQSRQSSAPRAERASSTPRASPCELSRPPLPNRGTPPSGVAGGPPGQPLHRRFRSTPSGP